MNYSERKTLRFHPIWWSRNWRMNDGLHVRVAAVRRSAMYLDARAICIVACTVIVCVWYRDNECINPSAVVVWGQSNSHNVAITVPIAVWCWCWWCGVLNCMSMRWKIVCACVNANSLIQAFTKWRTPVQMVDVVAVRVGCVAGNVWECECWICVRYCQCYGESAELI